MNIKKFIISLLLTFIIGSFPSWFITSSTGLLATPKLMPPDIVFPIVWSILYFLMSISLYLVWEKDNKIPIIYFIQLIVNSLWTVIFFGLKLRLLAFFWVIILIVLIIIMLIKFYKISKSSVLLNIPYLLWTIFASYLTISIYLLNK